MSALGHAGAPAPAPTVAGEEQQKRGWSGYLLMAPGSLWLLIFFLVPTITLVGSSLYDPSGSLLDGYENTFHFANYSDAVTQYWPTIVRSFLYAFLATLACIVLGFPL